ncbi:MAG: Xaa-Pro peptidase family protein [Verrucomicrobiota bacterium]
MRQQLKKSRAIYASSDHSADLYYATHFDVPDPVFWFEVRGKSYLLLSPLEVDRGRKSARVDCVLSLSDLSDEYQKAHQSAAVPKMEDLVVFLSAKFQIRKFQVPPDFPLFMADVLRGSGVEVLVSDPFFPARRKKKAEEVLCIIKGQRQAEAGLRRGMEILQAASIRKNQKLRWGNRLLTSELLRFEIEQAVRLAGGIPRHTIVAGGIQSCDPHDVGSGPLRAGETIILDIFPRDAESGYFGDLTRTVVKGQASESQRQLYTAVRQGQKKAIDAIKAGVDGAKLQQQIKNEFTAQGYATEVQDSRWVGFFHGLGHGLGLDIHEAPRIASGRLRAGDAITVEPGLYYPEIGGIRLENLVIVEPAGSRNLTKAAYRLEIP